MPLMVAHPIALAALAVIAIGVISYTIITNKKRKIPVRNRRIDYVEEYETETNFNDHYGEEYETETKFNDHPGVRKRHNANTAIKKPSSEKTESEKVSSTHNYRKFPDVSQSTTVEEEIFLNNLDSLDQNKDENCKVQNIIQNIIQQDSSKLDITKTVVDEDAESSVSNVSGNNSNDLRSEFNSLEDPKSKGNSLENIAEKLYLREVSETLRNDVETMSVSSLANSILSEDEDDMSNLRNFDDAVELPIICKGCEESYANAVAQPCGHRYLCLDCAIKVHRIYRKCSVCNFYIDTYDIYNPQES